MVPVSVAVRKHPAQTKIWPGMPELVPRRAEQRVTSKTCVPAGVKRFAAYAPRYASRRGAFSEEMRRKTLRS